MKKKILLNLLFIAVLFTITGCNPLSTKKDNYSEKDNITSSDHDDIELYSDNTKIVYESEQSKYVFYYSGNKITGYHIYTNYNGNTTAKYALSALEEQNDEKIAKAYVNGKYLVVEYKESEYNNLTVEEVKKIYSYLKESKK